MTQNLSNISQNNTISLCMIVKNEEKILRRCLNHIHRYVDEIIIVDTGSSDKTVKIAREFTDKVFFFEWCNDFSAARNFSLSKATKEWIMVLDADDFIEKPQYLKDIINKNSNDVFSFKKLNVHADYSRLSDRKYITCLVNQALITYQEKLFRNYKGLKFIGTVHERIFNTINKPCKFVGTNLKLYHLQDIQKYTAKFEYYNTLGKEAIQKGDMNCNVIVNLLRYYALQDNFIDFNNLLNKIKPFYFEKRIKPLVLSLIKLLIEKKRFQETKRIKEILCNSNLLVP